VPELPHRLGNDVSSARDDSIVRSSFVCSEVSAGPDWRHKHRRPCLVSLSKDVLRTDDQCTQELRLDLARLLVRVEYVRPSLRYIPSPGIM
jgi:hypothetical protein